MFKFIHAADIHIDSPLRGLEAYEGAPIEQLRGATREAFTELVSLAVEHEVSFVIIAGDLFDGKWPDMQTGLWTAGQFRRLERENIPVYLVRGNHDALSKVRHAVNWPPNVHEFSVRKPESFRIDSIGVALHGQGFAHQECLDDLANDYPEAIDDLFNIGVLHTSLTGSGDHDTYAPTRKDVLVGRGYDYWALGHIHQRSKPPISNRPYIAYSGNTQGRHIKEDGPKGCLLVTVDEEIESVQFCPTDKLRWQLVRVDLKEADQVADLLAAVNNELIACYERAGGKLCAIRLIVCGACAAHQHLVRRVEREEALAEIRNLANRLDEEVWIEKILLQTSPPIDLDRMRNGSDLIGELLRDVEAIESDDDQLLELSDVLKSLEAKAPVELKDAQIKFDDPEQIRGWLLEARGLLISQLMETDG